ncbi:Uncharacterised protein [uncultured archaeon]|nr:Uncharacterised protein [uncultured archaeon]
MKALVEQIKNPETKVPVNGLGQNGAVKNPLDAVLNKSTEKTLAAGLLPGASERLLQIREALVVGNAQDALLLLKDLVQASKGVLPQSAAGEYGLLVKALRPIVAHEGNKADYLGYRYHIPGPGAANLPPRTIADMGTLKQVYSVWNVLLNDLRLDSGPLPN